MHRHTLQTFRLAPSCVLCTPRPHQRGMLVFTKVCWKWSLHAFSNIPVLWSELFVVVAQWQGFKSAVTSSVSFVYNFSGLSDKEAIPFSTDNPRDSYTWFNKVSSVKAFNLTPVRASGVFLKTETATDELLLDTLVTSWRVITILKTAAYEFDIKHDMTVLFTACWTDMKCRVVSDATWNTEDETG